MWKAMGGRPLLVPVPAWALKGAPAAGSLHLCRAHAAGLRTGHQNLYEALISARRGARIESGRPNVAPDLVFAVSVMLLLSTL
jgi:hypothetical protein